MVLATAVALLLALMAGSGAAKAKKKSVTYVFRGEVSAVNAGSGVVNVRVVKANKAARSVARPGKKVRFKTTGSTKIKVNAREAKGPRALAPGQKAVVRTRTKAGSRNKTYTARAIHARSGSYNRNWRGVSTGVLAHGASRSKLAAYKRKVGHYPNVVLFFQNWRDHEFDRAAMDRITSVGATPLVTWVPKRLDHARDCQPDYHLRQDILTGKHDAYIRRYARAAKTYGKPFMLRLASEMNGYWNSWSPGQNDCQGQPAITPRDYVDFWRHVYTIFRQEGATNARFVWSPDAGGRGIDDLYPGNSYVHWTSLDGYDKDPGNVVSVARIFAKRKGEIDRLAPNKPFGITETAMSGPGSRKAAWIRRSYLRDLPGPMSDVKFIVYWDENTSGHNYRLSGAAADALRNVVKRPEYRRQLNP
jgi:hypothetical protein